MLILTNILFDLLLHLYFLIHHYTSFIIVVLMMFGSNIGSCKVEREEQLHTSETSVNDVFMLIHYLN